MKESTRYTLPEQTGLLLSAGRYKDAFTLMRRKLTENPQPGMLSTLSHLESTYRYMLHYFGLNADDPTRAGILADLRVHLLEMADFLYREEMAIDSSESYFSTLRMCRLRPVDVKALLSSIAECKAMVELSDSAGGDSSSMVRKIEEAEISLFNSFWTSSDVGKDEYRALLDGMSSGTVSFQTAALCIAAVGLGLMRFYSRDGVQFLVKSAASDDLLIRARSLVALTLVLAKWPERVRDDVELMQSLQVLMDIEGMDSHVKEVAMAVIRTRDTDRVSRKMRQELMPGLMQLGPDLIKKLKDQSQDASFSELEGNPEWEDILHKTGLDEKLRELTDMQTDGADVMMVAFSNLKNFPFFRQISNWFLPFSISHTHLEPLRSIDASSVSDLLDMSGLMCDSDKYSFAFSFAHMPAEQKMMVMSQMQGQLEQMREAMAELALHNAAAAFSTEVTRFLRDLYRFNKLYPKKADFPDPFEAPLPFLSLPFPGDSLTDDDTIRLVGEFYFKRGYYSDALPLFLRLSESHSEEPHVWEKIGFCMEKRDDGTQSAIEAYMKAQLFNPDSKWIARRLAYCYRRIGKHRHAIEYILQLLPDDRYDEKLTLLLADTLMDSEKWDDALRQLYRVDYETPGRGDILRRMAQCSLHMKDFDKATSLLERIPELELTEDDHRLKGHLSLMKGDNFGAMTNYRRTVRLNDTKRQWKTAILSDQKMLEKYGVNAENLQLVLEALTYDLES